MFLFGWREVKIKDLGIIYTGRTPSKDNPEHFGVEIPFITPSDMDGRRVIDQPLRYLSQEGSKALAKILIKKGVGVSCIGWQMGKSILIKQPSVTNQQINSIIPDEDLVDPLFLYYGMSNRRDEFFRLAAGGSRTPILKKSDFENLPFILPPLYEQKKIAHILGTLDDKIELNQQMNQTLEGIARALFKSWFIDFDPVRAKLNGRQPYGMDAETAALFPNSFEDSPLGKIPKGWEVKILSEVTTKIGSGATPRGGSQVYVDEGISLIRSQNVYDYEFRWDGLAFMTEDTATQLKNVVVEPDDILLNITGDSILRTCVVDPSVLPARVNQHVAIIRAKKGIPCRYLHLHLVNPQMKNILLGFDTGATRKAVTKGQLESVKILIPNHEVLHVFDKLTKPMFQNIQTNLIESRALTSVRDVLLPRLLSGEIRVKEAERTLEVVA